MAIKLPSTTTGAIPLAAFDRRSGSRIERTLFNHRPLVLLVCALLTLILGWEATHLRVAADFERTIPTRHPYIVNFFKHYDDLRQQGNALRVIVEPKRGTIINKDYLQALRDINDEVTTLPGVDRGNVLSLWSPNMRWTTVTADGFAAGLVVPDNYDGSKKSLGEVARNIPLSGQLGQIVANDFKSSIIYLPLFNISGPTGAKLDYGKLSHQLDAIRVKYASRGVDVRIVGFAKIVGDMIAADTQLLLSFGISVLIAAAFLYWYTRCVSSTLLVVLCSLIAVVWQTGIIVLLGQQLDPYSTLVPFLIFAIGMSHGAQKMNGVMQDIGRGTQKLIAARMTFRRLFMAGFSALVCDAVGFAVLYIIQIAAIRQLAVMASIGVAILVFTNLILLPILLSYIGVNARAARRALDAEQRALAGHNRVWDFLGLFTQPRYAALALVVCAVLGAGGLYVRQGLQIGDLDRGAPELRPHSQYNQDNAYLTQHYAISSDVLIVMVNTPSGGCNNYHALRAMDTLQWQIQQVPGVDSARSLSSIDRLLTMSVSEGNPKWYELLQSQRTLNDISQMGPRGFANRSCDMDSLYIYLSDHKAQTLERVTAKLKTLIAQNTAPGFSFELAAGSAGIDAATNEVVSKALHTMLFWVYGAVSLLSLIAFRSWRATACAILPLVLTSILAEALMVVLGIGVKVDTLPVVALGVGIGVDYALYILSIVLTMLRAGADLSTAYRSSLMFTGRVVLLTGFTLAASVSTWVFAPIKFQADMGVLLAFMFLWNMLGALIPLPALACFLLSPRNTSRIQAVRAAQPGIRLQ